MLPEDGWEIHVVTYYNARYLTGGIFPWIHPVSSRVDVWDGIPEVSALEKSL